MEEKIIEFINKYEIISAVNRYFQALDEKNFDASHFATIFTKEAKIIRPNGVAMTGPDEVCSSHKQSFVRFDGTQHILTNHDVSITGQKKAIARVNLVAMHMWEGSKNNANDMDNFFIAGGVINAELMQVEKQWKISKISNTNVWRGGAFKNMLQTK